MPIRYAVLLAVFTFSGGWVASQNVNSQRHSERSLNPPMESKWGWCSNGKTFWPARVSDDKSVQCFMADMGK